MIPAAPAASLKPAAGEPAARDAAPPAGERPSLGIAAKVLYGVGEVANASKTVLFGLFLVFFYTSVMGLPGTLVGAATAIGLVWDAAVDPFVGYASDRARLPLGRRHAFMLVGAVLVGPTFWALFSPPPGLSTGALFAWLLVTSLLVRTAHSIFVVPYHALGAALSRDYHERTAITAVRGACALAGTVATAGLSFVLFFPNTVAGQDPKLSYAGYPAMGLALGLAMSVAALVATLATLRWRPYLAGDEAGPKPGMTGMNGASSDGRAPAGDVARHEGTPSWRDGRPGTSVMIRPGPVDKSQRGVPSHDGLPGASGQSDGSRPAAWRWRSGAARLAGFLADFLVALRNGPFRALALSYSLMFLGTVINGALAVHFLTYYVAIAESAALSSLQFAFYGGALAGVLVWLRLARRTEKRRLYLVGAVATALLMLGATALFGDGRLFGTGNAAPLLAGQALAGFFGSLFWILPHSMLADVADADELATGRRREGIFFGILSFSQQLATGLAVLVTGVLLDWFAGLAPGQAEQTALTIERIGLLFGVLPAALLLAAALAILGYQLDRRRVVAIQARLAPECGGR
jgi:GPH family glycoside/pentoside/hexuronide:cation symporter